jgi:DNA-binding transcriptional ArsR family regulator
MLRLHFTHDDLARIRFLQEPLPLWEASFSARALQRRDAAALFGRWQQQASSRLTPTARPLFSLIRPSGYIPGFLDAIDPELDAALDLLLATPPRQVRADLGRLHTDHQPSVFARQLAADDHARRQLVDAVRSWWLAGLDHNWVLIRAHVDADLAWRTRILLAGGVERLLGTLHPSIRWRSPILEIDKPMDRDVDLGGRGLWLLPSEFAWPEPLVAIDPERQPVLAYPLRDAGALDGNPTTDAGGTLAAVLGQTRAAVLAALADGCSTSELAHRLKISIASASEHTGVLRQAGLVVTQRAGRGVHHSLTELGSGLLQVRAHQRSLRQ